MKPVVLGLLVCVFGLSVAQAELRGHSYAELRGHSYAELRGHSYNDPINVLRAPLSKVVSNPTPWLAIEGNSDQRQPVYFGATPRELVLGLPRPERLTLPASLKAVAEDQAARVRQALGRGAAEFETWPAQNDDGQRTWVFARWRAAPADVWEWLDRRALKVATSRVKAMVEPVLPNLKRTWVKEEHGALFTDFLKLKSLYEKPLFGDAVWADPESGEIFGAWLPVDQREAFAAKLKANPHDHFVAHILSQPARFNGEPVTFVVRSDAKGVSFADEIEWKERAPLPKAVVLPEALKAGQVKTWPATFDADYERDVRYLAGKTFTRKNSAEKNNQLLALVEYLRGRYKALGLRTLRHEFDWRGIRQSNLIAIIPGRLPRLLNRPVLLADHIDTAFNEDTFKKSGKRVSGPGADDNGTATAALLRAAEVLRHSRPEHDIWLVHLTGEEYPADDLGARRFVERLFERRRDIGGLVLMDMIGYREKDDRVFQINAGDNERSRLMAFTALDAAGTAASAWTPQLRDRFDSKSYLYNTDGVVFSDSGLPVILLNEHINGEENLYRRHYHEATDTPDRLDFAYAASIARVAIETAARLSKQP